MHHPVDQRDTNAVHGRARELTVLHRLAHALVDRGTEALRDDAADDLVDVLVFRLARAVLHRRDEDLAVAELTATARLLLVPVPGARLLANRLLVRHPRWMQLDRDVEAALQTVDRDLDLHLRQPGDELLAGLRVAPERDRRVFLREAPQAGRHLLLVALRLRRDREAHDRLGEVDVRRLDRDFVIDEHVAGDDVLQLRDGAEVADAERVDRLVVLAVQKQDLPEALLRVRARIDEG